MLPYFVPMQAYLTQQVGSTECGTEPRKLASFKSKKQLPSTPTLLPQPSLVKNWYQSQVCKFTFSLCFIPQSQQRLLLHLFGTEQRQLNEGGFVSAVSVDCIIIRFYVIRFVLSWTELKNNWSDYIKFFCSEVVCSLPLQICKKVRKVRCKVSQAPYLVLTGFCWNWAAVVKVII